MSNPSLDAPHEKAEISLQAGQYQLRSNEKGEKRIFGPIGDGPEVAAFFILNGFTRLEQSADALSFLHAKKLFGYALTTMQEKMVAGEITNFELHAKGAWEEILSTKQEKT